MFDAAGLVEVAVVADALDPTQTNESGADTPTTSSDKQNDNSGEFTEFPVPPTDQNSGVIVFIDSGVQDYQSLINAISPNAEIVILDADRDGIEQITEFLEGQTDVSSIHVISHGEPGKVLLGNAELSLDTLNQYTSQLNNWANALNQDTDFLLYGCDVGSTEAGLIFIQRLAELTGADIAASTDTTGAAYLGGDWDLEVQAGDITTPLAINAEGLATYDYFLAPNQAPVISASGAEVVNEDTALVFSTGTSNLVSVADPDSGAGELLTTLSVTSGTLTLSQITGLTFSTGDGTADATLVFTGTLTDLNAALDGMSYTGNANFNGSDTLNITVNDQGNTGDAPLTPLEDTAAIGITVTSVNDDPVLANAGATLAYTEQVAASVIDAGLTIADCPAPL